MKLVTSTNIYFERKEGDFIPLEECLRMCAASGYRELDFGFAELSIISKRFTGVDWQSELLEYKALADSLGLRFVQAHATILDFCNPGQDFAQKEELFRRSIVGAAMLRIPWIVVHPSTGVLDGSADPDTHRKNVEFFKQYSQFAKAQGIGLAIENMWGKGLEGIPHYAIQAEELLCLIEDIDCENVRICWDVEHGSIEKLNQREAIRRLGRFIVATHISDHTGSNNIHILPYMGNADWEEILGALAAINYQGIFDFEIQHYLPGVPKELVPAAMRFSYEVGMQMVQSLKERRLHHLRNQL